MGVWLDREAMSLQGVTVGVTRTKCPVSCGNYQGRSQKFVLDGDKTGGLGTEVPQRGPGAEPWWRSGAKPPEAGHIC